MLYFKSGGKFCQHTYCNYQFLVDDIATHSIRPSDENIWIAFYRRLRKDRGYYKTTKMGKWEELERYIQM